MTRLRHLSRKRRIILAIASLGLLVVALLAVGYLVTTVPTPTRIATAQGTRILYADGTEMGRMGTNRTIVPLSQIDAAAQHAVLAAEDRQFFHESGISPRGIARALFSNVSGGGVSQGGSTITQQYAKNAFLTQRRTYTRKVKEIFIAMKMSQTVGKGTILADYLNTIYFGRGAYGIEAAAGTYFGTTAARLTPAQSAVLASSIRSPAGYDPTLHPQHAHERWSYVLDGMVTQHWLSPTERQSMTYPAVRPIRGASFPGALDAVRSQVVAELARHGFGEGLLAMGGLSVRTTIVRSSQTAAIAAVQAAVPAPTGPHPPVAALVAVQPGTGKVIAYYGSRTPGGFDYASDGPGVQPGSSMKPYVLAAALEKGDTLSTQLDGSSPQSICGTTVHNDSGDPPLRSTDLVTGLSLSVNTVYYRLACQTGAQRVADLAHAAGIPSADPLADTVTHQPTAQIALGSGGYEIHVIDQATGYATFAAEGVAAKPYFVQQVRQNGKTVYTAEATVTSAMSRAVAANTTFAMEQVVNAGTGTRAQLNGRPTAGKTGTTGNNANAWFAGFTPQLSTAVWVGREGGTPLKGVLGSTGGVYGGTVPASIFKAFMDAALKGQPALSFPARVDIRTNQPVSSYRSPGASSSPTPSPTSSALTSIATPQPGHDPAVTTTQSPSAQPAAATSAPAASPSQATAASTSPQPQPAQTGSPAPAASP